MALNRNATRSSARLGFTLVELIVVMGIIAVLMGILLPAMNRSREQSRKVKCLSNIRTIGQGFAVYASENKGCLPYGFGVPGYTNTLAGRDYFDWVSVTDYILSKKSRPNLYFAGTDASSSSGGRYPVVSEVFLCPSVPTDFVMDTHYGVNPVAFPNWFLETVNGGGQPFSNDSQGRGTGGTFPPVRLTNVAADNLLLWDTHALSGSDRGPSVWSSYSCIDNQNLVQWRSPSLRYRVSRELTSTANNIYQGQGQYIIVPKPENPEVYDPEDFLFNYDVAIDTVDNSQLGNIRFRHGNNKECNVLMGDFSGQTLQFDKKKLHPRVPLLSYFVDIRRYQLRLKKKTY